VQNRIERRGGSGGGDRILGRPTKRKGKKTPRTKLTGSKKGGILLQEKKKKEETSFKNLGKCPTGGGGGSQSKPEKRSWMGCNGGGGVEKNPLALGVTREKRPPGPT